MFCYRVFPFRGYLKGAVGIIRQNGGFVVIDRNDGFGLAFPGGGCKGGEQPSETLCREVEEETGLLVASSALRFSFRDKSLYPAETYVYEARASGHLQSSWEGEVLVAGIEDLKSGIICSQRPILEWLERQAAGIS